MAARAPPAAALRDQYVSAGTDRYDTIAQQVEAALAQATVDDQSAADLAAIITAWLVSKQLAADVRPDAQSVGAADWVDDAIDAAYRDGIQYARRSLREAGVALDATTVDARLNQPHHATTRDATLADQRRVWRRLAADLEDEVAQAVREAARQGATDRAIARRVEHRIEAVGEHRARLIGRTEPARAFHRATLAEWKLIGVTQVEVNWETVGDTNVCASCRAGAAGSPYSLAQAEGLLPHHVQCRCWLSPDAASLEGPRR